MLGGWHALGNGHSAQGSRIKFGEVFEAIAARELTDLVRDTIAMSASNCRQEAAREFPCRLLVGGPCCIGAVRALFR